MNYSGFIVNFQKQHLARTFKYITWFFSLALFFTTCFALLLPKGELSNWSGMYHRIHNNHELNGLGITTVILFCLLVCSYISHLYFWKKYVEENPLNVFLLICILLTFATWVLMLVGTNPNLEDSEGGKVANLFVQMENNAGEVAIKYTTEGIIMIIWVSLCAAIQTCIYSFDFYINHFKIQTRVQEAPASKKITSKQKKSSK